MSSASFVNRCRPHATLVWSRRSHCIFLLLATLPFLTFLPLQAQTPAAPPQPGDVYREFLVVPTAGQYRFSLTEADLAGALRAHIQLDRRTVGASKLQLRFNNRPFLLLPETAATGCAVTRSNPTFDIPLTDLIAGANRLEASFSPLLPGCLSNQDQATAANQPATAGAVPKADAGTALAISSPGSNISAPSGSLPAMWIRIFYAVRVQSIYARITSPRPGATFSDNPEIRIESDPDAEQIQILAYYEGPDEDGDGIFEQFHGFLRNQQAGGLAGHVGTLVPDTGGKQPNRAIALRLTWNTDWLPDQTERSIALLVRVRHRNGLWSVGLPVRQLSLERKKFSVRMVKPVARPQSDTTKPPSLEWPLASQWEVNGKPAQVAEARVAYVPAEDGPALPALAPLPRAAWPGQGFSREAGPAAIPVSPPTPAASGAVLLLRLTPERPAK